MPWRKPTTRYCITTRRLEDGVYRTHTGGRRYEYFLDLNFVSLSCNLLYLQSMTLKEACKSALTILKQVMEEKLNATNVEVNTVIP